MRGKRFFFLIGLLLATDLGAQKLGETTAFPIPDGETAKELVIADLNGDGLDDLLIAIVTDNGIRKLNVHLRRKDGARFVGRPDQQLGVGDASAFAVADVHSDPGREIVLLSAQGAFCLRPTAKEDERVTRLFPAELLWQIPHDARVRAVQELVSDLDGDGQDDLLIPEPNGYLIALNRRSGGETRFETTRIRLPEEGVADAAGTGRQALRLQGRRERTSLRVQIQPGDATEKELAQKGPLVQVVEDCPVPQLIDWNGDGKRDLICQGVDQLFVYLQGNGFPSAPSMRLFLPVVADRERRLDISYSAHLEDFNRDGRADALFFSGDQRSQEIRTQVQLFVQGQGQDASTPLFGKGLPQQYLVLRGFAGIPQLVDVDGDGLVDLVTGSVRPDLLDKLRSGGKGKVETELYVFKNQGKEFSRSPDLVYGVSLPADDLRDARSGRAATFFADVTGEGTRELLLRNERDRVSLLYVRKERDGKLQILAKPLFEMAISRSAVLYPHVRDQQRPELVILEGRQAVHIRF